jgi:hypothetical protein
MRPRRAWLLCVSLLLLLAASGRAAAEAARSRVALVRTQSDDKLLREASTRLRAELVSAGFDVVEVERAPGDSRTEVEQAAERTQSVATVAIDRAGRGAAADIWISDRISGKTVVRRLRVGGGPSAATVLAIRALELLRASLLEVVAPPPAADEPAPAAPPDVVEWVKPTLPPKAAETKDLLDGLALGVGVQALHGVRGVGLAFGPTLRAFHGIAGGAFGRLVLAGPFGGQSLSEPEGTASVRQEFASLDLGWATPPAPLGALAWIGAGAFHLHTSGAAAVPYRSTSDDVYSLLLGGGLGGIARFSQDVALSAELSALALLPRPVVVIASRDAGSSGNPALSLSLNLLLAL